MFVKGIPTVFAGRADEYLGETIGRLAGAGRTDLARTGKISNATQQLAAQNLAVVNGSLASAAAAFQAAVQLQPRIPMARQQYFQTAVKYQAALHHHGLSAIAQLAASLLASTHDEAVAAANASLASMDELFAEQRLAEGTGEWRGLFSGDRLMYAALQNRRRALLAYQLQLVAGPPVADSGAGYYSFYDYQNAYVDNYPLLYPSPQFKTNDFVAMNCSSPVGCRTGPDGGVFWGATTSVAFWTTRCRTQDDFMPVPACSGSVDIYYSLDGSAPATLYKGPVVLSRTTTITAVVAVNGTRHTNTTRSATWTQHH